MFSKNFLLKNKNFSGFFPFGCYTVSYFYLLSEMDVIENMTSVVSVNIWILG